MPTMEELTEAAATVDPRVVARLKDWSRLKFNKTEAAASRRGAAHGGGGIGTAGGGARTADRVLAEIS